MKDKEIVSIRFCIPALGAKVCLTKPWDFTLYSEYRNYKLWLALGGTSDKWEGYSHGSLKSMPATVPAGTILTLDRIYVRKGKSDYDSITFTCPKKFQVSNVGGLFVGHRWWSKLRDVNAIECQPIGSDPLNLEVYRSFADPGARWLEL